MREPALVAVSLQVYQIKTNKKVHCRQGHLATCGIQRVKDLAQVEHGCLLGGQGVDKGSTGHQIFGPQLGQVAPRVRQARGYCGDGTKEVRPVDGRRGHQYVEEQRMPRRQRDELPERVVSWTIAGDEVLADMVGDWLRLAATAPA